MFKQLVTVALFSLITLGLSACEPQVDAPQESQTLSEKAPTENPAQTSESTDVETATNKGGGSGGSSGTDSTIDGNKDYHSQSNPDQVLVEHISLDLTVDFDRKVLDGSATLRLKRLNPAAKILRLDTRDLTINSVKSSDQTLSYQLKPNNELLGAALEITLADQDDDVTINYTTAPTASGVQWLTPAQTAGGKQPFLFTQAQATHARSFIPLQDSPQVRVTYDATIRTPKELVAVMSASNDPEATRDGVFEFNMPQPIPSYLIALAVGDLEFKAMGERTGVYAEPSVLEAAAAEFEDTESMLIATEKRYGPYSWDRYDLLILPPSFPFGGMENPRLSFITPTVIAGDKSLVSLIAHELAHSWSGNTVTNATWRDLWLNEGFTTYLTYRIMELVYGTDRFNMEAVLGYQDLEADIESLQPEHEKLAIDLRGKDPDLVFSNIPYEKGALFLTEIEHSIGRDNFDAFLLQYFKEFAFKSITTDEFLSYVDRTLLKDYSDQLNRERINQWVFEPGIPASAPEPQSDAFVKIDASRKAWLSDDLKAEKIDTQSWTTHEWLYFLNNLPQLLEESQLRALDDAFKLTASTNNEIAHSWLLIAVENWYTPALPRLREYLTTIGRNKLVKPLYRALSKTDKGKELGRAAFAKAKPGYHPLTVKANQEFVE